jgi:outer membrane protein
MCEEWMMKTMFKAGMLAVLLSAGATLAADFKVGVVDTERVLRESAPAMKAESKIEKEFSGRDQEIKKLMKQAKELQAQLDKDDGKLSEADHRNKERELSAMNVDLQRMQREFREDLNLRKNEELAIVLEQANKAIQAIAEAEKYDLILQEAVYRNPKIDITDMVIKHLADSKADSKSDSKAGK